MISGRCLLYKRSFYQWCTTLLSCIIRGYRCVFHWFSKSGLPFRGWD